MPQGAYNLAKTHCRRGHPFAGDNLHVRPNGARSCRTCMALYTRAKRLGLTVDDLLRMMEEQAGACAICGAEETLSRSGKVQSLAVDHSHETGQVRGLLCAKCNLALGLMDDNPEILRAALEYLAKYDDELRLMTKEV